jgi:Cu(I)/Ag(I) efflux system membrane fusion protein
VVLGPQADDYVQILSGLDLGERIVGSANFLVDAESRLSSTGGSMPGMQHGSEQVEEATETPEHQHD